ncbi:hypothetical protein LOCC1_G005697 [Lachnellula occidentalis]|uniref:Uncharacterized protein n=1 Tax=Lachnellula occidentalis TaxID=215460 RepID=A0A8H8RSB6_9HELO|nr:hypothetical protein LOCC1_G005697 [Lachnellula occidentalis]
MKAAEIPGDSGSSNALDIQLSGGIGIDSLDVHREESSLSIPHHPLGVKPLGNKYTATSDAKDSTGYFKIFPDEVLAIFLDYLEAPELLRYKRKEVAYVKAVLLSGARLEPERR